MTARSLSTVDANILRPQELPDSGIGSTGLDSDAPSNNDHNYTLSPGLDAYLLNFSYLDFICLLKMKKKIRQLIQLLFIQTKTLKPSRF